MRVYTDNTQRQAVVALWGSANFNGDAVRRQLVEVVIYGLLDLKISSNNAGAAELALNALNSVGKPLPSRIKGALGKRVKSAVTGTKSLEDRALVVLPTLGYKTTTNFFGKPKRVRYDD